LSPETETRARELLQRQWNEIDAARIPPPGPDSKSLQEAEKRAKAEAKAREGADARAKRDIEKLNTEQKAKARAEARKRSEAEAQSIAAARAREDRPKRKAPSAGATARNGANISAELPPPNGLNVSKQQRLADLLEDYKQDKITPSEYHEKRAKILAEP
jgi:membrane protein involved in colicin uptake